MTNKIYPSSSGDCYSHQDWTSFSYQEQFEVITDSIYHPYLAVEKEGIVSISLIKRIMHFIKGFFGFGDSAHQTKLNSELLKFVYYGATNGLLQESMTKKLRAECYLLNSRLAYPAMQSLIQETLRLQQIQSASEKTRCLAKMQAIIIDYHYENASTLRPHLWSRWFQKHSQIDSNQIRNFGDTPLLLAKQVLEDKNPNPVLALGHFLNAHTAHNHSPEFQQRFWKEFQSFLKTYCNDVNIISKQFKVERIVFDMASIEFERNNAPQAQEYFDFLLEYYPSDELIKRQVGESYLHHKQYEKALPYFTLLQQHYPSKSDIYEKIALAYVALNQPAEAVKMYSKALELSKLQHGQTYKKIGQIHFEISQLYLNKWDGLTEEESLAKALDHLSHAYEQSQPQLKSQLLQLYTKQRTHLPEQFEAIYGERFVEFISKGFIYNPANTEQEQAIQAILLDCIEKTLVNRQLDRAMNYLKAGLSLFTANPAYSDQLIELSLKYGVSQNLIEYFSKVYESGSVNSITNIKFLSQIYAKQWKHAPDHFESTYGQKHLEFISKASAYSSPDQQKEQKAILLDCIKKAFASHQTGRAVEYLKNGLLLFLNDPIFCYLLLDLSLFHKASHHLISYLTRIDQNFTTNATIKKKIGDLYWENKDKPTAIQFYLKATPLYEAQMAKATTDTERLACKKHLAAANYHLALSMIENPNYWINATLNTAINLLVKAVDTANPEIAHRQTLARAYIQAGDEESQTSFFNLDREINTRTYYEKAYWAYPQTGEYLRKLIEIYLKNSMDSDLAHLYLNMQSSNLDMTTLPADLHSKIAKRLQSQRVGENPIARCIEQAYRLDSRNPILKKDFCEMRHKAIAEKLDRAATMVDNQSKIDALKAIEVELQTVTREDLSTIPDIQKRYDSTFSRTYQLLAEAYSKKFSYPTTIPYELVSEANKYFTKYQADIRETLRYYDLAIQHDRENASLYFDKGSVYTLVLDDDVNAIECFEQAITFNPKNAFYRAYLWEIYGYLKSLGRGDYEKRIAELKAPIAEVHHHMLFDAYVHYKEERFSVEKPNGINPHKYRIVYDKPSTLKGLFVSPRAIDVVIDP